MDSMFQGCHNENSQAGRMQCQGEKQMMKVALKKKEEDQLG